MNDILYIKGDAGFKTALLAKLGGTWIHGHEDYNDAVLGLSVPANIFIEDLKEAIGYSTIINYNISFSNKPTGKNSDTPSKFVPGTPIKMSIWVNKNFTPQGSLIDKSGTSFPIRATSFPGSKVYR